MQAHMQPIPSAVIPTNQRERRNLQLLFALLSMSVQSKRNSAVPMEILLINDAVSF
jgi:ribosomal protein S2